MEEQEENTVDLEKKPVMKGYLTYVVCGVMIVHALSGAVLGYLHLPGGIDIQTAIVEVLGALGGIGIRRNL